MPKLKKVSPTKFAFACDCGGYQHQISRREDGEVMLESFLIGEPSEPAAAQAQKKTQKKWTGLFDAEDDD